MLDILIKNPTDNLEDVLKLPCEEVYIQSICNKIKIENTSTTEVYIQRVYFDLLADKLLKGKIYNLDELNYFFKRLDSLDDSELLTFYAVAEAEKLETMAELINLTFNTHCYSLVSDFSDLNAIGKKMYLNEKGAVSTKELQSFDGKAYLEQLIEKNHNSVITSLGVLYSSNNQPTIEYDGKHFPLHFWKDEIGVLELQFNKNSEFLYLPCTERETEKALLRLEVPSIYQCKLTLTGDHFSDRMLSIIMEEKPLAEHLENLNYFAEKLREIGIKEEKYFNKLIDYVSPQSQEELRVLLDNMYEFEIFDGIKNAAGYGTYMICDSGHFTYDSNLKEYIDFEKYGQQKISEENGTFTDKGYIVYQGCNREIAQLLNKNLGMQIEIKEQQTLKLYMPLKAFTYYDENDYGDLYQVDSEIEICPAELLNYEYEIKEALKERYMPEEKERGLMKYYGQQDSVNAKVKNYIFSVEEVNGKLMGVAELTLNAPLNDMELEKIKNVILGQASNGFGERFEQNEINCDGMDVYISFWGAENWSLQTAEELGITSNKMNLGGM